MLGVGRLAEGYSVFRIMRLVIVIMATLCTAAFAQSDEERYARQLSEEIATALEDGDTGEVLALVSAYERLGIKVPGEVFIAKGHAHLLDENLEEALAAYKKALADSSLSSLDRVKTEEAVRKISETLAAEAERKERLRQQLSLIHI